MEDLYPDSAHFIYELLQNAEDADATQAQFVLTEDRLAFEHDGRPFERRDIEAITDIGEGAKAGDADKIGRFGVGFKAVFAYSETPRIWSPTFSFKISELVLPYRLDRRTDLGEKTRFEFPFDNPKKPPAKAFEEIRAGLSELAETTLLFLTRLESIRWRIGAGAPGEILRVKHSDYHFEMLKQADGTTAGSHFLKFDRPVEGIEKQRVAVAFALDFLSGVDGFDKGNPLAERLKIVPATPGQVAVYFPAKKETSNLRFHVHAPFVPELSRASVKATPVNEPLFEQIADLAVESLFRIRDLGLLSTDFLAALPNPKDGVEKPYHVIRDRIVAAMNTKPLTPTHAGGHAPAKQLVLAARASLKSLLADQDLCFLLGRDGLQWAAAANQNGSDPDRFLRGLALTTWDVDDFVDRLSRGTAFQHGGAFGRWVADPPLMKWLSDKSPDWLQRAYAMLSVHNGRHRDFVHSNIVRSTTGRLLPPSEVCFPSDPGPTGANDGAPQVDPGVYTAREPKKKRQADDARKSLEAIGVKKIDESKRIVHALNSRYAQGKNHDPRRIDFEWFVKVWEKDRALGATFRQYRVLQSSDGAWRSASEICIDEPFDSTGLSAFHAALGDDARRHALADWYLETRIPRDRIVSFARDIGARTRLVPEKAECRTNPDSEHLFKAPGERNTGLGCDVDYTFRGLDVALRRPSLTLSRLVWRSLVKLRNTPERDYFKAVFRRNGTSKPHTADSQLVHQLRNAAWVPQENGGIRFVRPAEADQNLLPKDGFEFDPAWPWVAAIQFGWKSNKQRDLAREAGFKSVAVMEDAKWFASLSQELRTEFRKECERKARIDLPARSPADPVRRYEGVLEEALEAPEKKSGPHVRTVADGRAGTKARAAEYLKDQYNEDGVMICQICWDELPFKYDGDYYFEKRLFMPDLKREHRQNYLALCPNHEAMFRLAKIPTDDLVSMLMSMEGDSLELRILDTSQTIHFTETHRDDLRAVLESEGLG